MPLVTAPAFRKFASLFLVLAFLVAGCGLAHAAHGDKKPEKRGILLVAFGTSVAGADAAYMNVERKVRAAFPDVEVRWAYTSKIIRHKLAREKNVRLDSPAEALARMMDEDFTQVAVQSLQTIPGEEFHGLSETARAFSGMPKGMKRVTVGYPLLTTTGDLDKAADALLANLPKARKADEAVIFVGHGTSHPADVYYAGLQFHLWKKDRNAFVGAIGGAPTREEVTRELKKAGTRKAYLVPLLAVAGDHALNDIAGGEPDSWKSVLTAQGVSCEPVLKGTAEYDAVADIWVEHLKQAFESLK